MTFEQPFCRRGWWTERYMYAQKRKGSKKTDELGGKRGKLNNIGHRTESENKRKERCVGELFPPSLLPLALKSETALWRGREGRRGGCSPVLPFSLDCKDHLVCRPRYQTQHRAGEPAEDLTERRHERHQAGPAGKPGGWEIRWAARCVLFNSAIEKHLYVCCFIFVMTIQEGWIFKLFIYISAD